MRSDDNWHVPFEKSLYYNMSTVIIQVGQCGNQIGHSIWKRIANDESVVNSCSFIDHDGMYRAVAVDSEPKVIRKITKGSNFREKSLVSGKRGRGTNWALGYYGLKEPGDDSLLDDTLDAVRIEIERCDRFNGIILLHSVSGGTGSGLGSRLTEQLREDFSMHHLMSCTFAPCGSGESPLQHYNSLLTLAALQRNTDCIVLTSNDDVLYRVQKKKGDQSVSFMNINDAISSQLCGIFLPTDSLNIKSAFSIGMEPWEMVRSLTPLPSLKFVNIAQSSSSRMNWEGMLGQLTLTWRKFDPHGLPYSSLGNIVVGRGDSTGGFHLHTSALDTKIRKAFNCVSWNPFPVDYWSASRNSCNSKNSTSLTVASNSSSVVDFLGMVVDKSKEKFKAGAYLHWYRRYGASDGHFTEAFEDLHTIIDDYKDAVK